MRRHPFRSRTLAILVTLYGFGLSSYTFGQASTESGTAKGKRAPVLDDTFREQAIVGSLAVASDGQAVAFGIARTLEAEPAKALERREARSDIWVQLRRGEPIRNLTNGSSDGSGWWRPIWSPDGSKLLMLSTRGGRATPWIWERRSGQLRQVMTVGLEESDQNGGCRWVDQQRLVCLALSDDDSERIVNPSCPGYQLAERGWAKARRGEMTASVVSTTEFNGPVRRLVLLDTERAGHRLLAKADGPLYRASWWVSSETSTVIYAQPLKSSYARVEQDRLGYPSSLAIMRLDGRPLGLSNPLPDNVLATTVALSPDKAEVAFFAYDRAVVDPEVLYGETRAKDVVHERPVSKNNPARLWVVNLRSGRVEEVATGDIDLGRDAAPPSFQWLAAGELLFHTTRLSARMQLRASPKTEWLVLNRQGQVRALAFVNGEPPRLDVLDSGRTLLGLADQAVVRVDSRTGAMRRLTAESQRVAALSVYEGPSGAYAVIREGTPQGMVWNVYREMGLMHLFGGSSIPGTEARLLDLESGRTTLLPPPAPAASLADVTVSERTPSAWYTSDEPSGTFIWRAPLGAPAERLLALNTFRQDIQRYEERLFDYTSANGERLKALMVLPADFSPNRRYPVVVDSDVGYSPESAPAMYDVEHRKRQGYLGRDLLMFPAAGYVYIFASAPTEAMDSSTGRANLLSWHLGILPAVDKAIEMGVADPDRVVLYGGSSFGYGVYGVVTQTSRFKAAVAMAGWVDQQSMSVSVSTCARYLPEPFGGATGPKLSQRPSTFWRDFEQFHRNSPLTFVDRVQTPLMIVHNDGDFLPIEQAEMFYAALLQQRKPATFVRYWGEGHGQQLPANVRDFYQRVFAWFDRYADVQRDDAGAMVFEGERVKSRGSRAPLTSEAFARFAPFATSPSSATERAAQPE